VIRAVVCEDNLLVREGIVTLLTTEPDIAVVAQAGELDEALAAVAEHDPDVVLTDIRMPPTHTDEGVRVAAALRRSHPGLGVVVLSQYDDPDHALRVFDGGVARRGYLLKDSVAPPEQLVTAVRTVAAGGSTIDPLVVEAMLGARAAGVTGLRDRFGSALAALLDGRYHGTEAS